MGSGCSRSRSATTCRRRISDDALPARGKITGAYVNTALAVEEAHEADAEEAIFLTRDGHVSEGGSANLFMVRAGALITPPVYDDILEGITRDSLMRLAHDELGLSVLERSIDRTELYVADELFFCGTGAQVAPCVRVDGRPVADGAIGGRPQRSFERRIISIGSDAAVLIGNRPPPEHWCDLLRYRSQLLARIESIA
ncbi:MAG: hypothetical protein E6J24_04805 [Chloroflexi bacterium]|nr:MAG: hypothetical protein E6J24_04805 [Chloroflexota bacterium]